MIQPTIEEIAYPEDSAALFDRLRHLAGAIWLDSGKPRSLQGRFDIMSALPQVEIIVRDGRTQVRDNGDAAYHDGDPFELVWKVLQQKGLADSGPSQPPFTGGLMGYWSYDLGRQLHSLPTSGDASMPDAHLGWYGWGLVLAHDSRKTWLVTHPACDPAVVHQVRAALAGEPEETPDFHLLAPFKSDIDQLTYLKGFRHIQDYIERGDCYQVNFTIQHQAAYCGDPWYAYLALRKASPTPYSAYLQWGDISILSCSPERFLKVSSGKVETKPIKGTIARGATLEQDQENAILLQNSVKDRAENLMIVDMLRNDISRNCTGGSVTTPKLFALESFANVHHLVSTVTGTLSPGKTPLDLLRDSFPGGSITGTPKKRAMEIIAELEPHQRSIYCGSIGYISASGRMDTNIAIRTLLARNGEILCWGGGGVVSDSNGPQEYAEACQKIRNLMSCLESL
jgi:para-aminobenzoate synthetase component I